MTLLTADDVLNKTFQTTKFREGYDQDEVDDFLDEVVNSLRVLQGENAELKAKIATLEQGQGETARAASLDQTSQIAPIVDVVPEPEPEPEVVAPAPTPAPTPAPAPVAAPAYSGTPGNEPESATGMLQLAQRLHDEYVRNGMEEGEKILTEARTDADRVRNEAESQRARTLKQLETEQATLEHQISQLRAFERDYRMRLKGFLGSLVETLDAQASVVGLDGPPAQI